MSARNITSTQTIEQIAGDLEKSTKGDMKAIIREMDHSSIERFVSTAYDTTESIQLRNIAAKNTDVEDMDLELYLNGVIKMVESIKTLSESNRQKLRALVVDL